MFDVNPAPLKKHSEYFDMIIEPFEGWDDWCHSNPDDDSDHEDRLFDDDTEYDEDDDDEE